MKWTLVVPGALLPATLAPDLERVLCASPLARLLARAQVAAETSVAQGSAGAAHWAWLARAFGVDSDPPVTAPYAWQAFGNEESTPAAPWWIAFCDPVHMAVGSEGVVLMDLADAPLQEREAQDLLALANEVLGAAAAPVTPDRGTTGSRLPGLRMQSRGGQWFLLADRPVDLRAAPLDAALGQPVQHGTPSGADARQWRKLANEIQMLWHASSVNADREQRGARIVNAFWVHGGGQWTALPSNAITQLPLREQSTPDAVLRGWQQASAGGQRAAELPDGAGNARGDALGVCWALSAAFALQAWDLWLQRVRLLEERLERDLEQARDLGVARFELVLCGAQQTRSVTVPLRTPWWRRPYRTAHAPERTLRRWFREGEPAPAHEGRE